MDLNKYSAIQLLSVFGAGCSILTLPSRGPEPLAVALAACVIICIAAELLKDRVTVLFSGVKRYYRSFAPGQNAAVFSLVRERYRYFGVTFDSVKSAFTSWYLHNRQGSPSVQILISDPEAFHILEFQARYESDLLNDSLTPEQQERIARIVDRTRANIHSTLASLASTTPQVEVRLHQDRARRWTHEIDGRTLYLGLLRRGSSGLKSSVLVLTRQKSWTLFNHHHDGWEGLRRSPRHPRKT